MHVDVTQWTHVGYRRGSGSCSFPRPGAWTLTVACLLLLACKVPEVCTHVSEALEDQDVRLLDIEDVTEDGVADLLLLREDGYVVLLAGKGKGEFTFREKYPAGSTPRDLAIADLNGDGHKDLLVVGHFSNALTVLLGAGKGDFLPSTAYPLGNHSQRLQLSDFNEDGHLDVVTKNGGSAGFFTITLLLGNGDGTFGAATPYPTTGLPRDLGVADIDLDGHSDILVAIANQQVVDVFRGQGDGTLAPPSQLSLDEDPLRLALLDVNQDHRLDLLVTHGLASPGYISVHLGQEGGTFAAAQRITLDSPDRVLGIDLEGDGALDLAVTSLSGLLLLLKGSGDGTFVSASAPLYSGSWPISLVAGNFDKNGRADLAWITADDRLEMQFDVSTCNSKE